MPAADAIALPDGAFRTPLLAEASRLRFSCPRHDLLRCAPRAVGAVLAPLASIDLPRRQVRDSSACGHGQRSSTASGRRIVAVSSRCRNREGRAGRVPPLRRGGTVVKGGGVADVRVGLDGDACSRGAGGASSAPTAWGNGRQGWWRCGRVSRSRRRCVFARGGRGEPRPYGVGDRTSGWWRCGRVSRSRRRCVFARGERARN
jgi:hypothetical protein